jgi:hypothetical protein
MRECHPSWAGLSKKRPGRKPQPVWVGCGPAYAIDDETAIKVVDGTVEVVSEGHWKLFTRRAGATESGY